MKRVAARIRPLFQKMWAPRLTMLLFALSGGVAMAHEQPTGGIVDYVMTDWMLMTAFFGFMVPALLISLIAWRRGYFRDMEGEVKTFWLTPEPDYETPAWAWEQVPDWAREDAP